MPVQLPAGEIRDILNLNNNPDNHKKEVMVYGVLTDYYGVPGVKLITGKSITSILSENGVRFRLPEDLQNLMKKAIALDDHLTNNTKDLHNRRGLQLVEAKVRRLVKYYKRTGVLPQNWNYSLKNARLLIE